MDQLESVKKKLNLRRLVVTKIKLKKNRELEKLVIGFSWSLGEKKFKVNYQTSLPKKPLNESELSDYVLDKINYLKTSLLAPIDKYQEKLNQLPLETKKELDYFLSLVLGEFSGSIEKSEKLLKQAEYIDEKVNRKERLKKEEEKIKTIQDQLQITEYQNYFSKARQHKRKLKLYIGPTNSGKTYLALNDLATHNSGIYLSPLRLLAWEGMEELEKRGKTTSLITGEERNVKEGAKFKSQTIETLDFSNYYDCVLIDEIQMLSDEHRGWAWSQALIGASCKELIMAGSPESEPLVKKMAEILGEELEIIRLERFNPLEVSSKVYRFPQDIHKIPEGSAIIAFSRKNILYYKDVFAKNGLKASVIYGNLGPDLRIEESRKFRDGETKFLIASDSISLGLNYNISNIIFSTVEKFNGREQTILTPMEIKQISGRAGRFGKFEKGMVSAFDQRDLNYIKSAINKESKANNFFYIKPSLEHVLTIAGELNTNSLLPILSFFTQKVMSRKSGSELYVCSHMEEQKELALLLDKVSGLSLEDKFLFANAPVPGDEHHFMFLKWVKSYQKGDSIAPPKISDLPIDRFKFDEQFRMENYVKALTLYSWLSFKKPNFFPDQELSKKIKNEANKRIEKLLAK